MKAIRVAVVGDEVASLNRMSTPTPTRLLMSGCGGGRWSGIIEPDPQFYLRFAHPALRWWAMEWHHRTTSTGVDVEAEKFMLQWFITRVMKRHYRTFVWPFHNCGM